MNVLEKLGYGATATVIGLLIVFAGLTIIILSLKVMALVFQTVEKRKAAKAAAALPKVEAPAVEAAPALEASAENTVEADDGELIAVIAAAIAAFDFGGSEKLVKIKSIRRVSGWKSAARTEQVYKF
jgi:Na+-transporting methylmalonyl-CoA/oxaloacetate decarboxylase gamma subunit